MTIDIATTASTIPAYFEGTTAIAREEEMLAQLTTIDGLIAFFSEKIRETNGALRTMLQGQEGRGKVIRALGDLQAILGGIKEGEKLAPGHEKWGEFMTVYDSVKGLLSDVDRARFDAVLDGAVKRQVPFQTPEGEGWNDYDKAVAFARTCKGRCEVEPHIDGKWYVKAPEGGPAAGIDPGQAKEVGLKLKNLADELGQQNQGESIRVQELVARIGQLTSLCSNIVAKFDEAKMAPINNLRG